MKKKQIAFLRLIAFILIMIISAIPVFSQEKIIVNTMVGCSICIKDCASNVISLALEHTEMEKDRYSDYPKGCDSYDPIAMGEIDPWEAYSALQAEEMDRAMTEEAQRAWQEYNEPQPDISDRVIKP